MFKLRPFPVIQHLDRAMLSCLCPGPVPKEDGKVRKKSAVFCCYVFVDALLQTWSWLYVWTMWFCSWKGVCNQVIRGIVRMKHFAVIFISRCLRVLTDVFVVWRTQHSSNLNLCDWIFIYIYTPVWFITHMIRIHIANPNVWSNGRDPLQKNWVVIVTSVAPNWSFTWYFHAVSCLFLRSLGW